VALDEELHLGLGLVDRRARLRALFRRQLAEALQQLRERARLAEEARLRLLEVGDGLSGFDGLRGLFENVLEHFFEWFQLTLTPALSQGRG
jgi:hypothetical protein